MHAGHPLQLAAAANVGAGPPAFDGAATRTMLRCILPPSLSKVSADSFGSIRLCLRSRCIRVRACVCVSGCVPSCLGAGFEAKGPASGHQQLFLDPSSTRSEVCIGSLTDAMCTPRTLHCHMS